MSESANGAAERGGFAALSADSIASERQWGWSGVLKDWAFGAPGVPSGHFDSARVTVATASVWACGGSGFALAGTRMARARLLRTAVAMLGLVLGSSWSTGCDPGCESDADCEAGQTCEGVVNASCQDPECRSDDDCPAGYECDKFECAAPASFDAGAGDEPVDAAGDARDDE